MPVLVQVCVVVVTVAIVALAVFAMRMMKCIEETAAEFKKTAEVARRSMDQVEGVAREVRGVAVSFGDVVPRIKGVVARFEELGERTARMSNAVLEEVEAPVRTAVSVMRGVRTATTRLVGALIHSAHRNSATNGGSSHV